MTIGIMNGPNLGRLGKRVPEVYGSETLTDLEERLRGAFPGAKLEFFQSNHEGALIDCLERWHGSGIRDVVLNAGALTHQSYALRDALEGLELRFVEVHISNVYRREPFRAHSLLAPVAVGQISGLGLRGYELAVRFLLDV